MKVLIRDLRTGEKKNIALRFLFDL